MTNAERYSITVRKVLVDDQELWRATVRELPDLAEFAEARDEAFDLALDAIESLKASAVQEGRPFPEPMEDDEEYSGRVTLRMSKSMHRTVAERATVEDVSLNSYVVECIALRLGSFVDPNTAQARSATLNFGYFGEQVRDWIEGSATNLTVISSAIGSEHPLSNVVPQIAIGVTTSFPIGVAMPVPEHSLYRSRRT